MMLDCNFYIKRAQTLHGTQKGELNTYCRGELVRIVALFRHDLCLLASGKFITMGAITFFFDGSTFGRI